MRPLLGILLLVAIFLAAARWQSRETGRLVRERDQLHGRSAQPTSRFAADQRLEDIGQEPGPGGSSAPWSTLVIGVPSGAAPHFPVEPAVEIPAPGPGPLAAGEAGAALPLSNLSSTVETGGEEQKGEEEPTTAPAGFRYRVRRGDVLGTICSDFYGAERGAFENLTQLSLAVARFNDIDPNTLSAGDELLLPTLADLRP